MTKKEGGNCCRYFYHSCRAALEQTGIDTIERYLSANFQPGLNFHRLLDNAVLMLRLYTVFETPPALRQVDGLCLMQSRPTERIRLAKPTTRTLPISLSLSLSLSHRLLLFLPSRIFRIFSYQELPVRRRHRLEVKQAAPSEIRLLVRPVSYRMTSSSRVSFFFFSSDLTRFEETNDAHESR